MNDSKLTTDKIKQSLDKKERFDGRKLEEYRDLVIETNVSKNAEGSAKVKLGDTEVIAGIKISVAEPYPDHEKEGTLMTTFELLPLSSGRFEPGPPKIEAIELARVIDRGIRESKFIDFEKLCIKEGEKVYSVCLDIYTINDDGNLMDAGFIAALAALKTAKMPKYDEKTEKIVYGELTDKNVPISKKEPLMITFYKIGETIVLDPVREEEVSSKTRLSVTFTKEKEININAMQKGGEGVFSEEEILSIIENGEKKSEEIKKKIDLLLK
jgi:exosome complex component RRP42